MKNTLIPTPVLTGTPASERFGSAPTATRQWSGLPFAAMAGSFARGVTGGSYAPGSNAHLIALGGFRKDADGVPPRGRRV